MPQTIAQAVDESIQSHLEHHGIEIIESLAEIREKFEFISREEYAEFVKRNLKEFTKVILDTVKDQML